VCRSSHLQTSYFFQHCQLPKCQYKNISFLNMFSFILLYCNSAYFVKRKSTCKNSVAWFEVFSVVMLCSVMVGYCCFGGPCYLHLQVSSWGVHGSLSSKPWKNRRHSLRKSDLLPPDLTVPKTYLFRAIQHPLHVKISYTSFLSPPGTLSQECFTHLPIGTHISLPHPLCPEDGGCKILQNIGILL